ncbi:MAG: lipid-A-disaccharide synthase [Sphingobacteriales bacterium]|nr:lipid-A-disaccharide synthase [Sphingobacteriales bacterium]
MRYYIIAGEASGDLHGSNLIKELAVIDPKAEFRCWGGDLMQAQGAMLVKHYRDLAFMGFFEVVANLPTILKNIRLCKADITKWKPDVVIFIDYPGFNLRIASFARKAGFKTVYYISPQIWAWKESRIRTIRRDVDRMLVILPFEKEFYASRGMEVDFVGHPLLDAIDVNNKDPQWKEHHEIPAEKKLVALLPGSRKQEIRAMLPAMLEATRNRTDFYTVIACAPSIQASFYRQWITESDSVRLVAGETQAVLQHADAALVTSGTATLETALYGVPQVVAYKGHPVSVWIARKLVKIRFISLVNLIMDTEVVKELIQDQMNAESLRTELDKLLQDSHRNRLKTAYQELRQRLGVKGASKKAAKLIYNYLCSIN